MKIEQLINEVSSQKENINSILQLLKKISGFEKNRKENLFRIRNCILQLNIILKKDDINFPNKDLLKEWINQYDQEIIGLEEDSMKHFGIELEQELKKIGLSLSGQYPELKSGFFTLEIISVNRNINIWYGPKQERLSQCQFSTNEVVKKIKEIREKLGCRLNEELFISKLQFACSRVAIKQKDKPNPIIKVLGELSFILQNQKFLNDPQRYNYKGYGRADFSYDLFKARRLEQSFNFERKFRLVVATRINTTKRQDFLWIPDDESGKGTLYSHIQFKEELQ